MAEFSTAPRFVESAGGHKVDARLLDVLRTAAAIYGLDVQATSGVAPRAAGTKNHIMGNAVDIQLIDPTTGKALPNYQNGPSFEAYEKFAQTARVVQQEKYPELTHTFRWGGYFSHKGSAFGYGAADLMHFDITPSAHGATALGSWEGGASKALLDAYPGAVSNGGLGGLNGQRFVAQVRGQLADPSLVPPADIPAVGTALDTQPPPVPMPRPTQLNGEVPVPRPRPTPPIPAPTLGGPAYGRGVLGSMERNAVAQSVQAAPMQGPRLPAPTLQTLPPPPIAGQPEPGFDHGDIKVISVNPNGTPVVPPTPPVPVPNGNLVGGDLLAAGLSPITAPFTPNINDYVTPMQRPASLSATAVPPVPMSRPMATSAPPAVPAPQRAVSAPPQAQPLARLPSGKMIAPGTYPSSNDGSTVTITRGPDGSAVMQHNNPGFMNLAKMGPDTVAGGVIGQKIGQTLPQIGAGIGNAYNGASSAVQGFVANPGEKLGSALDGIQSMLFGGAPAAPSFVSTFPARPAVIASNGSRPPIPLPAPLFSRSKPPAVPQRRIGSGVPGSTIGYANGNWIFAE